jgi:two-component system response regulator
MENNAVEILLVEDNYDAVEFALLAFKKNNITNKVYVARDGVEALEYLFGSVDGNDLRNGHLQIILLDLKLPRIDGLQVLKRIKTHPKAKKIPVVVLTSSREQKDMVQSYNLGANSFIQKPADFHQFTEVVNQICCYWLLLNRQPECVPGESPLKNS